MGWASGGNVPTAAVDASACSTRMRRRGCHVARKVRGRGLWVRFAPARGGAETFCCAGVYWGILGWDVGDARTGMEDGNARLREPCICVHFRAMGLRAVAPRTR